MKIKNVEKSSLVDYPPNICATLFVSGCNFRCPFCFTGDNKIFTVDGIYTIKDIVENKLHKSVYDINGKFNIISKFYKRKYSGDLINIKTYMNSESISCTPNHNFFVSDDFKLIKKIKAENITKDDYLTISIPQNKIDINLSSKEAIEHLYNKIKTNKLNVDKKILSKIKKYRDGGISWRKIYKLLNITDHYRRIYNGSYYKTRSITPDIIETKTKIRIKGSGNYIDKNIKIDKKLSRLIGYFLSEGCVSKNKNRKNSYYLSFTFNKKEENLIEDVKTIMLEKFNIIMKESISEKNNTKTLICYNNTICMFFKYYFGKDVYRKKLPSDFIFLKKIYQKELIKGLFYGDGISSEKYIKKYQIQRINITSEYLRNQISLILFRCGIMHNRFRKELIISDKKIFKLLNQSHLISKKSYNQNIHKITNKYIFLKIKELNKIKKKNINVYNLEIDDKIHSYNISLVNVSNCYNKTLIPMDDKNLPDIPESEILQWLEKRFGKLDAVCITGGEPTLFNHELTSLIHPIKSMGYKVKLDTNGSNPALLDFLIKSRMIDYVAMDIKGDIENYGSYIGIPEYDTSNIENSIKIIKTSGIQHEFRMTVVPGLHNSANIQKAIFYVGKDNFILQGFKPINTLDPRYEKIAPYSDSELKKIADNLGIKSR